MPPFPGILSPECASGHGDSATAAGSPRKVPVTETPLPRDTLGKTTDSSITGDTLPSPRRWSVPMAVHAKFGSSDLP